MGGLDYVLPFTATTVFLTGLAPGRGVNSILSGCFPWHEGLQDEPPCEF